MGILQNVNPVMGPSGTPDCPIPLRFMIKLDAFKLFGGYDEKL
jgi:hypothetical protein